MIPIRDDTPTYSKPYINYLLIALNVVVYIFELQADAQFVNQFAVVPLKVEAALGLVHIPGLNGSLVPLFTSMFLHGSWWHLLGNMWFLWIFGDNIEDYLGHFSYLIFTWSAE